GRRVALWYKDRGIWQEFTWQDYLAHARAFGLGLAALGLAPGEKVAILCGNRPEWLYAEVGTLAAGGIAVGVYQDAIAREIGYVIDHADAAYVVAEDQEQLDKVLEVREDLPKVRRIITVDPVRPDDQLFSYLPPPWIGEIAMSIATALVFGIPVNFPEEAETARDDGREIGPTVLFGPPRLWEALTSQVQVKLMDTTPFK